MMLREFICRWFFLGHKWDNFAMFKRRCVRCPVEEWVFTKKNPRIGEPASEWDDMTIRPIRLGWRFRAWLCRRRISL